MNVATAGSGARLDPEAGTATAGSALIDSTPYPWPWDGQFAARRCALLVLQTADPVLPVADPAWPVIDELGDELGAAGGVVVAVTSVRPGRLTHPHAAPAEASNPTCSPRRGASITVTTPGWDAFFETGLDGVLRNAGCDLLFLAGGWLEIGVHSTMRSANDRGYECLLLTDACIAISDVTRAATISSTEMSGGIFGAVGTAAQVLELLASSR